MDEPPDGEPDPRSRVLIGMVTDGATGTPPRGYYERKAEGWCVYGACQRRADGWPDPTHYYCQQHRVKVLRRKAKAAVAERHSLRDAGKCRTCRKPSATYRCLACSIKDRSKLVSSRVLMGMVTDREAQIAAATRTHDDGRTRYHGQQKRGQQPKWQLNMQDLRHVTQDFAKFSEYLNVLSTPEAQKRHKSDLRAAELEIASIGESVSRRLDDILERLGHFKQKHGPRDGE